MVSESVPFEDHFVQTNGVTLHVVQAGPPDGELVILLHGFPEFWYGWRRQIEALAKRGFRVWAPDQRGYNLSEKPDGIRSYHLDLLAKDVIGLVDAAGREKAFLAGHDWGAGVTWHTALWHPARLHKIAILNVPHPAVMSRTLRSSARQMLKSWYMFYFQIPRLPEWMMAVGDSAAAARQLISSSRPGTFSDADIARYLEAWRQPGAWTAMINWYRSVFQNDPKLPRDIRVKVPTLMIWGAQDAFLSETMAQPSIDLCDDGRLVRFPEATHWVQHEEAHQVSAQMAEWFGG
ncbi:MAG: alpha/beta hydrolase [Anaerolineae bacterium]|nr:alpha/beta hydrolase [Anaerolineae bacterium]